jgi:hypothetical protein
MDALILVDVEAQEAAIHGRSSGQPRNASALLEPGGGSSLAVAIASPGKRDDSFTSGSFRTWSGWALVEPERKMPTALTLSLVGIISPSEGG